MNDMIKVLICDDSALIRAKLKTLVELNGNSLILFAENGEQGVQQYKEHRPDVVFMDIVMPVKTGIEALKEIREFDPSAKVVMASSAGTQANLLEALKYGAYDFVQKPVAAEMIAGVLSKVLKERELV
ncbi:response regulator [Paenibacillus hamazuiensis]|uniref:response regulator n=1 Tax=Paenibacillus hamazuiensis TaxID=2936508 RepID=UPI00200EE76D|nr:response regulator [Paenibacillus hamazuiensis]